MKNIQESNSGENQNLNSFNNTEQNSNFHIDINTNKTNCINHQETAGIKNIILKNNVIKIQRVYRNYKSRINSNKKNNNIDINDSLSSSSNNSENNIENDNSKEL